MIDRLIEILNRNGLIALPTDTVYGVIGDPTSEIAVNRVYELKNRPIGKKLSIFLKHRNEIKNICKTNDFIDNFIENELANNTIILEKIDHGYLSLISDDTIGIRIPNNDFIIELLEKYNRPVFATSINISGEKECLSYRDVINKFSNKIDLIVEKDCDASNRPSNIYKINGEDIIKIR